MLWACMLRILPWSWVGPLAEIHALRCYPAECKAKRSWISHQTYVNWDTQDWPTRTIILLGAQERLPQEKSHLHRSATQTLGGSKSLSVICNLHQKEVIAQKTRPLHTQANVTCKSRDAKTALIHQDTLFLSVAIANLTENGRIWIWDTQRNPWLCSS